MAAFVSGRFDSGRRRAQHTCLVHGLEAFNRVSERLLEFRITYAERGPQAEPSPPAGVGGERRGEQANAA